MRSLPGVGGLLCALALALPAALVAQETRVVSGVVVDAATAAPVPDVLVTIPSTTLRAVTDPYGRFWIEDVPTGDLQLTLRHVAYGEHAQPLPVGASGALEYRIKISSRAIELLPVVVQVLSDVELERRASGSSINILDRPVLDALAARGETLMTALAVVPGVHVNGTCVEYRLQTFARAPRPADEELLDDQPPLVCRGMAIHVDGIPTQGGSDFLRSLSIRDVESIQVMSPSEAGVRYADGARGVLVVETRRGAGALGPDTRVAVTGFGWDEPEPYRWVRVLGWSALGNAALVGLAATTIIECDPDGGWIVPPTRCQPMVGMGTGAVTAVIGGFLTRRVGGTAWSEGRVIPSFMIGAATATAGWVLRQRGATEDSDAARVAGNVVLVVGVPLALTLTDRVFRVLR